MGRLEVKWSQLMTVHSFIDKELQLVSTPAA